MVKIGMKVFDYDGNDLILSYGDTEAEIISLVKMNHNDRMHYDRSRRTGVERFFLNVADRGEYCEFNVQDMLWTQTGVYDDKTDTTTFDVGVIACLHDGAKVHAFDFNGESGGEGVYSSVGLFVFTGDMSMFEDVGLQYTVKGERVFLSAGICLGHVYIEQVSGSREYSFLITEESDEV
jgi:hypothetical protein